MEMRDTDKQRKLHGNNRAKGAAATGLCKRSGFVALSTIGVARDILGSQAPPMSFVINRLMSYVGPHLKNNQVFQDL
jgi:hypothetical protein